MPLTLALLSTTVGVGGALYGSGEQAKSGDEAAALQALGIDLSTAAELEMFYTSLEIAAPYREAGYEMLPEYEKAAFSTDMSPGFDVAAKYGERAIKRQAAAGGKLHSTETGEKMTDLYQNLVADEYAKRYGYQTDLANIGAGHAAGGMEAALGTGRDLSNIYGSTYANLAQNAMAQGAQRAGTAQVISQGVQSGINAYNLYNMSRN